MRRRRAHRGVAVCIARDGDALRRRCFSCTVMLDDGSRIEGVLSAGSDETGQPPLAAPIEKYGYHRMTVGRHVTTLAVAPQRRGQLEGH